MLKIFHFDFNYVCLQKEYIKKWLKKIADIGYNSILWEVEDKIHWETCPECVWSEAISKQDFKEILNYSRDIGLEPIPLLQTIGHAEYVLSKKEYLHFRENSERHDCYCTSNQEVRSFLKKWINEYLELFENVKYFHLGGDEAYEFGTCPTCSEFVNKHGRNKLFFRHIMELAKPLLDRGIRPGIWTDMILQFPEEINSIPKDFVLWDWNYGASDLKNESARIWGMGLIDKDKIPQNIIDKFPELINVDGNINPFYTSDFLKKRGYDVITCSASRSAGDSIYCGKNSYHAENIIGSARKAAKTCLLGNCVTSWAIRQHALETQEQLLYLMPLTLKYPDKTYNQILNDAGEQIYQPDSKDFFVAIDLIASTHLLNTSRQLGLQWNGLKDQLPVPPNFIRDYLTLLSCENIDNIWSNRKQTLDKAQNNIEQGIKLLNKFAKKATINQSLIQEWQLVGHWQVLHVNIARAIIKKYDSKQVPEALLIDKFIAQKESYKNKLKQFQTEKSAIMNANLSFDALIKYLQE